MTRCKSCGKPIVFIRSARTGKAIPCNPDKYRLVNDEGQVVEGRQTHFETCPDADRWRKRRPRKNDTKAPVLTKK